MKMRLAVAFIDEMNSCIVQDKDENNIRCEDEVLIKIPTGAGTWISARYGLMYLAFFGFVNIYAMRVNLSVAILSMVNSSFVLPNNHTNLDSECPASFNKTAKSDGDFNWDKNQQGLVLGAFFYGYLITQIPGGYFASKFGGKMLFGGGVLCTAILTLLTPIAAQTSFALLIVVRILEGIGEGVTFPAMQAMLGVWAPPWERSRLSSLVYAGVHLGTVIAQPISGVLCASNILGGWPSVFYIFGIVAIFWCILWFIFASSYPQECKWVTESELKYIHSSVKLHENFHVPWKAIWFSKEVWAIYMAIFSSNWGFYTLLTCLPSYLKDVLKYDITQDGFVASVPYLIAWLSMILSGLLADYLLTRGWLNTTQTRKLFTIIAFVFPAAFTLGTGFIGCNRIVAISFICLSLCFLVFGISGFGTNSIDLSPRFAGLIVGIGNMIGTIPGFLSPTVVGLLTENNPSRQQWSYVFYISASVYMVGAVAFFFLASGEEQAWNNVPDNDDGNQNLLNE
ncbi:unnamed protein product [Clavelina lepadiformis]|uniref:Major facilitator superfamily (MFS) profile domain-containing protein n=1 Tax=Clavelina lepadiformis TaxID=159417 RepID=A0ABP0F173_CLALP